MTLDLYKGYLYILIIKRITTILYQSDSILELDLDPLSLSGIDYWSQEARSAKVKLLLDDSLQSILVGHLREIKAGFHTFKAFLYDDANTLIYTGVLPESAFSIEYLSLSAKTVELQLIDLLGLILQLAADRIISLPDQYLNPVSTIPSIIDSILRPLSLEPDAGSYSNADVFADDKIAPYAQYVHEGRKAGKMPPIAPIEEWARKKRLLSNATPNVKRSVHLNSRTKLSQKQQNLTDRYHSLAWALARNMKYNELKPRRFLIEAILSSLKDYS
ncbi:MAG: hypothetical protein PWP64_1575 [Candidatus Cloacimonadota bacterium]|nr:hypothetical protein [Candidatus Cloacimonadota bacterium]